MSRTDVRAPRLFVERPLAEGAMVALDRDRGHYLAHVLRLSAGDAVLLFNGRDGEWRALIRAAGKKDVALAVETLTRAQTPTPDLTYAFAPLKHARLDYIAQKAVEMGASRLAPVITQRTQAQRVNGERLRANAVEAAEQCGVLVAPVVDEEVKLARFLDARAPDDLLVFCDEEADLADPVAALRAASARREGGAGLVLLVGPEGGFSPEERTMILGRRAVVRLSLGPRILRADTAGVAALALVQAAIGDFAPL
jgi:16S rRNA (uracil1498-N3)-methyltransferase